MPCMTVCNIYIYIIILCRNYNLSTYIHNIIRLQNDILNIYIIIIYHILWLDNARPSEIGPRCLQSNGGMASLVLAQCPRPIRLLTLGTNIRNNFGMTPEMGQWYHVRIHRKHMIITTSWWAPWPRSWGGYEHLLGNHGENILAHMGY